MSEQAVAALLVALLFGVYLLEKHQLAAILYVAFIAAVGFFIYKRNQAQKRAKEEQEKDNERRFWACVDQIVSTHVAILARKKRQLVTQDDYGNYQFDAWFREIQYFIENVIEKDEDAALMPFLPFPQTTKLALQKEVIRQVTNYAQESAEFLDVTAADSLDPVQFEHYCSDVLSRSGWTTRVTQASGDQGIDVVAHYGNVKAVFQCKKYSQPVGNGAVQEIIAGKVFEQAQVAVVVTNSTFTPSAKQLAASADVHLLHFSDLPTFAEKLNLVKA